MEAVDRLIKKLSEESIKQTYSKRQKINIDETDPIPKRRIDEDVNQDELAALKLRDTLDPTKFYKRKAIKKDPKKFHIGTVIEHPIDFYSARIPKKQRKATLVDDLIADYKPTIKRRFYNKNVKAKAKALVDRRKMLQGKKKVKE